jgi:phospholipid/cholesterol/gamma-HCH transport system permease protein
MAVESGTRSGLRASNPILGVVAEAGELISFGGRSALQLLGTGRYFAETLRQCGILIVGSALIVLSLEMVVGSECSLVVAYLLRPIGASSFIGFNTQICGVRELYPYMFAYIFAAKVGCGLVAEIGSMRINDEIAALEAQGVDPMRYVVATRLMAILMTVPFLYLLGMVIGTIGSYVIAVIQFGEVSRGQWTALFFGTQTFTDNVFSLIKTMTMATTIGVVGTYYGYRARGGPVGVGAATARAMMVNLVLIHVIGAVLSALFWGTDSRIPYGG